MDNKLGGVVSVEDVIRTALIFERYMWGEWSKGIAEHVLEKATTKIADEIEKQFDAAIDVEADDQTRPTSA